ncbi:hypothetical protein AB0N95_35910 [Streptomyces microflavus]|uniref:hypothetical protein n=1 Tax=Streptomyces microflavus TaxID=1919 RepID=UPI00343BE17E
MSPNKREWMCPGCAEALAGPTVVIQLIAETEGREHVSRKWTAAGEVANPTS